MTDIEQKILKMEFENKKFESNVTESLSTIDKLKKALNFKDAGKGLSEIDAAAKKVNFGGMFNGLSSLTSQFSLLDVVGVTALVNIANQAVNTGKRIISSLTIDPIKTGLQEYETKMNAITTIMTNTASKGTTLDDVNESLAELNEYADLTIYNFAEMTRNIGTFTAAGVDLDTSTAAIKGIANLAAGSGSTAQQASTAMYQLSQAISSGVVMLQDWNSVVNAGMGGELFQRALLEQKVAMAGTQDEVNTYTQYLKDWEEGALTFRNIISEGIIDSETLVQTLNGFSDNQMLIDAATQVRTVTQLMDVMAESVQSGWAQSWEYIIGNQDQAKKLLTDISDGFSNMIGPSVEARNAALDYWNTWGGRYMVIKGFKNILEGIQAVIEPINEAFREFFPRTTGQDLMQLSRDFRDLTEGFKIGESSIENIGRIFKGVFAIFDLGVHAVKVLADGFFSLFGTFTGGGPILEWLAEGGDRLVALNDAVKSGKVFEDGMEKMTTAIKNFSTGVSNYLSPIIADIEAWYTTVPSKIQAIGESISGFFTGLEAPEFNLDLGVLSKPFTEMSASLDGVSTAGEKVQQVFKDMWTALQPLRDGFALVTDFVKDLYFWLKEKIMGIDLNWDNVIDVGIFGTLLIALNKLRNFSLDDLFGNSSIYDGIIDALDGVRGALDAYQQTINANNMLKIAAAIALLAGSMILLASIEPAKLGGAMSAMTLLLVGLFGGSGILAKIADSSGLGIAGQMTITMLALSASMLLLAEAVSKLDAVSEEKIVGATNAIGILMAAMTASMAAFIAVPGGGGSMLTVAAGIVGMAYAMVKITDAVAILADMESDKMWQGIQGVSVIFGALSAFALATTKNKISAATGIGVLAVAKAMTIFYESIVLFGNLNWEVFSQGLTMIFASLGAIVVNLKLLQSTNPVQSAIGLTIVAGALRLLLEVVKAYGNTDFETMSTGIMWLFAALGAVAVPLKLLAGTNVIGIAFGIGVLAASLMLLTYPIEKFGNMPLGVIAKGLGVLVVALLAIAGLAYLLAPTIPVIFSLGLALLTISGAVFLASAGIFLLSAALAALAVSGVAGAAAVTAIIAAVLVGIAVGIAGAIAVFNEAWPTIEKFIRNLLGTLIVIFEDELPKIVDLIFDFAVLLLDRLKGFVPDLINFVIDTILLIIHQIEVRMDDIWEAAFDLFIAFLNGFTAALEGNTEELKQAMYDLFEALIKAALSILTNDKISYDQFMDAAEKMVMKIVEGVETGIQWVKDVFNDIVDTAKNALNVGDEMVQAGKDFVQGFIDGVKSYVSNAWSAAKDVGAAALDGLTNVLDINSPSKKAEDSGDYFGEGFIDGILNWVKRANSTAKDFGESAMDGLRSAISTAADMVGSDEVAPVITPVLDLTNIESGASDLNKILGNTTVSAQVAASQTGAANARILNGIVNNNFTGDFYIREDSDIDGVARELYKMQVAAERG